MRIVVAGGTGFLGTALATRLRAEGHTVAVLTRHPRHPQDVLWNPDNASTAWTDALEGAGAVVNLAGASLAKRWTAVHKREMWSSRVLYTRKLVAAMKGLRRMPPILLSGSAIGLYGARDDEPLTEGSVPGTGFLASLCAEWEQEALSAAPDARVVLLRSGIVLDQKGGALPQMALPFRFLVGGPIGSGRQYLSWIHRDDWTGIVSLALTADRVSGPLNVTAPSPVTNMEFARTLGRVLRRPAVMPAPTFVLRVVLGEMADMITSGQRVLPANAHAFGYRFRYPLLEPSLRAIYRA